MLFCIRIKAVQHNDGTDLLGLRVEVLLLRRYSETDGDLLVLEILLTYFYILTRRIVFR